MFYYLCGRSVRGCAISFFRILFYILNCCRSPLYVCLFFYIYFFFLFKRKLHFCDFIFYNDFIRFSASNFIKNNVISAKFQHSEQYAFEIQAVDTPLFHWRFL